MDIKSSIFASRMVASWDQAKKTLGSLGPGWAFRGQRDASWVIATSLDRSKSELSSAVSEQFLLREFQRRAHHYLAAELIPQDTLEWLALMQHHGCPTRLLDWTRSSYVAAYFAMEDVAPNAVAAVWAVDIEWYKKAAVDRASRNDRKIRLSTDFADPTVFDDLIMHNKIKGLVPVLPRRANQRWSSPNLAG